MRFTRISLGSLTLLLLVAVPVSGAPALQKGSQASYSLSVSISFMQSYCEQFPPTILTTGLECTIPLYIPGSVPQLCGLPVPNFVCPLPSLNITGTLGWAVANLDTTTANLNVTRDLAISNRSTNTPITHDTGSFNESINLATRVASILPFMEPEMDGALQLAQTNVATSLPAGTVWSSIMSFIDGTMILQPLHTMWWVDGPLKVNDTIPVLVFPTNVTGSTSLDLGGTIGTRTAWILGFPNKIQSLTTLLPTADNFGFALTFNYDQTSDLLLSANADIHLGFSQETTIQPNPCNSSATIVCPASSPVSVVMEFGIDVYASLKLKSTNLDLSQRLTPTTGPQTRIEPSPGSVTTPNPGSPSSGGYNPGSGSTPTGAGQPSSNPAQSKPSTRSADLLPWMYGILGIIAAAIVTSSVWVARRRMKKPVSQVPGVQSSP